MLRYLNSCKFTEFYNKKKGVIEKEIKINFFAFLFEFQVMCEQYWPASKDKEETYGDITVSILQEEEQANFRIRTLKLCRPQSDVSTLTIFILI